MGALSAAGCALHRGGVEPAPGMLLRRRRRPSVAAFRTEPGRRIPATCLYR